MLARINQPLDLAVRDIEAAVIEGVDAILVTKLEGPAHLRLLDEPVSRLEAKRSLPEGRICFMELIRGPVQRWEITCSTPRLMSSSLGAED